MGCLKPLQTIRAAQLSDWQHFYALASAEGWRIPQTERQLFLGPWSESARVLVDGDTFCGLVTAVAHQHSGWIGNLLIPPGRRGLGYGSALFEAAQAALSQPGVATLWLTASELGRPIYQKAGFVVIDRIERWIFSARQSSPAPIAVVDSPRDVLLQADQAAWGESRYSLLESVSAHGQVFVCDDAVALLQKGPDLQIFGPWYAPTPCLHSNRLLLQKLMAAADSRLEIVIDVFASSPLRDLLFAAGFVYRGKNELMAYGDVGSLGLQMMMALASLGSIG